MTKRNHAFAVATTHKNGVETISCFVDCPYCEQIYDTLAIFRTKKEAEEIAEKMYPKRKVFKIFIERPLTP